MKLSLIIPCFNEENNVTAFFDATERAFSGCGFSYEYVFVNDGSRDKTLENLKKLYNDNPTAFIKVLSLSRNFGKEAAVYTGLSHASGELTCIIDADLQQRPETVLKMMELLNGDTDCVAAYQDKRREGKVLSFFKSTFYKLINKFSDIEFVNGASDFRLFRKNVRDAILSMPEYYRFSKGLFSWVGFNTVYMPYEAEKRNDGVSKWSFKKLFKYAVEGIVSFTTAPLKFAMHLGIISSAVAFIYAVWVIIKRLAFGVEVQGYATIVVLILLLGGIQLICIGVIGEYLARIFVQSKNRPISIVKEVLSYDENDKKSD
ncbi:MAG: glycosyltransferase family 2 protein [Oscillospiraceae bacterium]|nr:glycosyltransferase family 2 protein [Oscillospiraceae bacterium]